MDMMIMWKMMSTTLALKNQIKNASLIMTGRTLKASSNTITSSTEAGVRGKEIQKELMKHQWSMDFKLNCNVNDYNYGIKSINHLLVNTMKVR